MLVTCLNSTIYLIDRSDGSSLQTYMGHKHSSYRIHSTFGFGEASVLSGDEDGKMWKWDLADGKNIQLEEKVAQKAVLWTEQNPSKEMDQIVTAASDGSVKVWKNT
jgi:mitogen-activated protein kinase organizer 1